MSENPFDCVPDGAYSWKERRSAFYFFFFFGKTVSSLLLKFLLYCLFLAVTGSSLLHELSLVVVHGLPAAEASLAVHGLWGTWTCQSLQHVGPVIVSHRPWSTGSVVVVHGLSCPERMLSVLLVSSPWSFK